MISFLSSERNDIITNNNNNNNDSHGIPTPSPTPSPNLVPMHLLEQLSSDILDHTKELGLFDELRMRLLEDIESSKGFTKFKNEFKKEVDIFCEGADLSSPRAKLRERLKSRILLKCSSRLRDQVDRIFRRHKQEIRQLYNESAILFMNSLQAKQKLETKTHSPTVAKEKQQDHRQQTKSI